MTSFLYSSGYHRIMRIDDLVEQNPWWKDPDLINGDQKIRDFENSKIKWMPRMMALFQIGVDKVYVMRGPRQVGKTTLVKLMIRELLSGKRDPRAILYFSCDMINKKEDVVDLIETFFEFSKRIDEERRYIFLDEVSSVKNWEMAIKHLVEVGKLNDTTSILTGSHALELKYSTERLPGRRGEGTDTLNKILIPMKFAEYVETICPDLRKDLSEFFSLKTVERHNIIFDLFKGNIHPMITDEIILYRDPLKELLDNYLITGGVMRAISQYYKADQIDSSVYEIYIRSTIGDLARWNYRESIAKQILRSTITRMTTRISFNSITEETEIGSHNTVSRYLEAFENSFIMNSILQPSDRRIEPNSRRERKVYFIDPFIYHAFSGWVRGNTNYYDRSTDLLFNSVEKSKLIEMLVCGHLIRCAYNLDPSDVFSPQEHVYFWKKKGSNKEIDFLLNHGESLYPIEVKYRSSVSRHDLSNMFGHGRGLLLSKDDIETYKTYSTLPVEIFLLFV